jgi:hypothetical protein
MAQRERPAARAQHCCVPQHVNMSLTSLSPPSLFSSTSFLTNSFTTTTEVRDESHLRVACSSQPVFPSHSPGSDDSPTRSAPSSLPSGPSSTSPTLRKLIKLGGVIGGVIAAALFTAIIISVWRRRKSQPHGVYHAMATSEAIDVGPMTTTQESLVPSAIESNPSSTLLRIDSCRASDENWRWHEA